MFDKEKIIVTNSAITLLKKAVNFTFIIFPFLIFVYFISSIVFS